MKTYTVNSPGSTKQKPYLCEKYKLLAISHGVATVWSSCGHENISISSSAIFSQISSKYISPLLLKVGRDYNFILSKLYVTSCLSDQTIKLLPTSFRVLWNSQLSDLHLFNPFSAMQKTVTYWYLRIKIMENYFEFVIKCK